MSAEKEEPVSQEMPHGAGHAQYREEVTQRWGEQAWAEGDRWWSSLSTADRAEFTDEHAAIAAQWAAARESGLPPDSPQAQRIAARHAAWIAVSWQGRAPSPDALRGLAAMYVADERFAANYGGVEGAAYVRDALVAYAASL